jgi:hypothetical protein
MISRLKRALIIIGLTYSHFPELVKFGHTTGEKSAGMISLQIKFKIITE